MYKKLFFTFLFTLTITESGYTDGLGSVAENIFTGADFLTKLLWVACIFVGTFLFTGFIVNYKEHRNNPKLVSMSTVITYLFLCLAVISIPFLNRMFGDDGYDVVNSETL